MIALTAGQMLSEHENPGKATVHVPHGRVRRGAGDRRLPAVDSSLPSVGSRSAGRATPSAARSTHGPSRGVALHRQGRAERRRAGELLAQGTDAMVNCTILASIFAGLPKGTCT